MTKKLLLTGGRVLDPASRTDANLEVLIEDGLIRGIYAPGTLGAEDTHGAVVRDVSGCIIAPGLIDMHVHLREPGGEANETILTGMKAAAAGGFTTICPMPNSPVTADSPEIIHMIKKRSQAIGLTEVLPIAAISKGLAGQEMNDLAALAESGAVAVSDDGMPVTSSRFMAKALEICRGLNILLIDHCEDPDLKGDGLMHEGAVSARLGLKGISAVSEAVPIARNLLLAQATGGRMHIAHISTKEGVALLEFARQQGIRATAEATPHHLRLTDEALSGLSTLARVSPPLRSPEHGEAVRRAVKSGLISCIATDHAPWSHQAKSQEFAKAPNGISGLETALAVAWDTLVVHDDMAPLDLIARLTIGPAAALGLDRGRLTPGGVADITVINPILKKTVDPRDFFSKGQNTPFGGMTLQGWPVMTIHRGTIVMEDGKVLIPKEEEK